MEDKEYITDDGVELTRSEAIELNNRQIEAVKRGNLLEMQELHFIYPKSLMKELKERRFVK